jgi:hypothetical protein
MPPPPRQVLEVVREPRIYLANEQAIYRSETNVPRLEIESPRNGEIVPSSKVRVHIKVSDNLYGDRVAIILDNGSDQTPSEPEKSLDLQNVRKGKHLLRALALTLWGESYKNEGALQWCVFSVASDSDGSSPTTTSRGQVLAENPSRITEPLTVDLSKPVLTVNVQNGLQIKEGQLVEIDFLLSNAKLKGDGGDYRVRYIIDDDEPQWIDKNEPIGLAGWIEGKHTVRLELIGPDGWPYRNGDYNVVTREISVSSK